MQKIKRLFSVLLVVLMVLTSAPLSGFTGIDLSDFKLAATAQAQENTVYSTEIYDYIILDDGTSEIVSYKGAESVVSVPSELGGHTVTSVGAAAFRNAGVKAVTVSSTISAIGAGAFENCVQLKSVDIVGNKVTIGDAAFSGCVSLTDVALSENVITIGNNAFAGCINLVNFHIPASVERIGGYVFYGNIGLKEITVDENNPYYSSDENGVLFDKQKNRLIAYPGGREDSIYRIPESVTEIFVGAFGFAFNLVNVELSSHINRIWARAFAFCINLVEIVIPAETLIIESDAFEACWSLKDTFVYSSDASLENGSVGLTKAVLTGSVQSVAGEYAAVRTLYAQGDYTAASDAEAALMSRISYTDTYMPCGTVYGYVCSTAASYANRNGIDFIELDSKGAIIDSDECGAEGDNATYTIYDSGIMVIEGTGAIDDYSMTLLASPKYPWRDYVEEVNYIIIRSGITAIGDNCFYNFENLQKVSIPSTVTEIGKNAFANCESLERVAIKSPQVEIRKNAFGYKVNILGSANGKYDSFTLYGVAGGTAEAYADSNDITFYCIHGYETEEPAIDRITDSEPTCTEYGIYRNICKVCDWEKIFTEDALGHKYGEGQVISEPTCNVHGQMKMVCSRCNEEAVIDLVRTGAVSYTLFDSGLEDASPTYSNPNKDEASLNNGGYDLYASYSNIPTIQLGQSYVADQTAYASLSLTVEAYDTDEESGEIDGIYLVDETGDSRVRIGQLTGADSTWNTTTITIDKTLLVAGHTYHFELTEEVSGWVIYVRSVTLNVTGEGHEYDEGVVTKEAGCTTLGTRTYTCELCGSTKNTSIWMTGHKYDAGVVTKEPTCAEAGKLTKTCTNCGRTSVSSIAKTEHVWSELAYPFSQTFNLDVSKYCINCGNATYKIFDSGVESTSPSYMSTNPAPTTADNNGYDLYSSYSVSPVIQTGLSFTANTEITNDVILTIEAYDSDIESGEIDGIYLVDETTGTETRIGELSGSDSTWYTTEIIIPAGAFTVGHSYHIKLQEEVSGWVVYVRSVYATDNNSANPFTYEITKQPTCAEEGEITYTFTNTGEIRVEVIPKLEHTYDDGVISKPATCSEKGEKLYTCSACNATKTEKIAVLSHNFDAGIVVKEPTCREEGTLLKTCTDCGATIYSAIDWLGHDFGNRTADGSVFVEPYAVQCNRCGGRYYEIFNSGVKGSYSVYKTTNSEGNTVSSNVDTATLNNGGYDIYLPIFSRNQIGIEFTLNNFFKNPVNLELYLYRTISSSGNCKVYLVDITTGDEIEIWDDKVTGKQWQILSIELRPEYFVEGHAYAIEFKGGMLGIVYVRSAHISEAEIAHDYVEISRIDATCTASGQINYECADCGKLYSEKIEVLGHRYDAGAVTTEPTCTQYGIFTKVCERCGNKSESEVEPLGHELHPAAENTYFYFDAADGLVCRRCGTVCHTLFNSGKMEDSKPVGYDSSNLLGYIIVAHNYDEATVDNGGYDIFTNMNYIPDARLGLGFTVANDIPDRVNVSVLLNIYTKNAEEAEIRLVDETTGEAVLLDEIEVTGSHWEKTEVSVPSSALVTGHTYHIEISMISGFVTLGYVAVRDVYIQVDDADGHKWNIGTVTTEATCENDGEITFTCADADCTEISTKIIPALGHNYVSEKIKDETCTENGILRTSCTRCGDYSDADIIAEHKYELTDSLAATCDKEGYMEYTCSVCDDKYRETVTVTHNYVISANQHATTTEAGFVTYVCTECGDTYNEIIPALGTDKYVLLVRDRIPWTVEADYNLLNHLVSENYISGWNVTSSDKLDEITLSDYAIVYIANDQTTATYNTLADNKDLLESYAENGGVLIYGACDGGWANGQINEMLPGNVSAMRNYAMHNYVLDANHRFVTGELTDLKAVTDNLLQGTYCSHTYFDKSTLPEGSRIILQDNNTNPTLVEYPYGEGHIVLSGLTWEFYYVRSFLSASATTTYSKNAFDDLFVYGLTMNPEEHTEHTFSAIEIVDSTCTESGKIVYACSGCGETNVVELPPIGHNWSDWTDSENQESHERVCLNDNSHIDYEAHSLDEGNTIVEADCCREGEIVYSCSVCDAQISETVEIKPDIHGAYGVISENAVTPTCTDAGFSGTVKCNGCGGVIDAGEEIPAIGHAWSDWTDNENGAHIRICANDEAHTEAEVHSWDEGKAVKSATCCETGEMLYKCIVCDSEKTEDIALDADRHAYATEITGVKQETCEASGYTGDTVCTGCKKVIQTGELVDPLGHIYEDCTDNGDGTHSINCEREGCTDAIIEEHDWSVTGKTDADCVNEGILTSECDLCHCIKTEKIDKSGHTLIKTEAVASTCTANGNTAYYTCSVCGEFFADMDGKNKIEKDSWIQPADGHKLSDWEITIEASCSAEGEKQRYCTECGYVEKSAVAVLVHTPGEPVKENIISADCETEGCYDSVVYCEICLFELSRETKKIDATEHDWDDGVIDPEATCTVHGTITFTCRINSNHTKTEAVPIDSSNHVGETYIKDKFDASCSADGYTGDKYCSDCDALLEKGESVQKLEHDWDSWYTVTEADCEADGLEKRVCRNDDTHTETKAIAAIGHNWDNGAVTTVATCKTSGVMTYTCQNDSKHTRTEEIPVDKDMHMGETYLSDVLAATCEQDGYSGDSYCSDCDTLLAKGEAVAATGHDWGDWIVEVEATYDNTGIRKQICKNDQSHINTELIPVLTRPSEDNESIGTDKTVDYDSLTGEAVIRLLASSEGDVITTNARIPLDIVLVLDQSGSMADGNLLNTLKDSVDKFTTAIHNDAVKNNIDHRIAMVGFAMQNADKNYPKDYPKYLNTEVLTTGDAPIQYESLASDEMNQVYKDALVPVDVGGELNPVITLARNNLEAKGATAADLGLDMACKIFSQNKIEDGTRKRIVVFMTDGVPTYGSSYDSNTAENAVSKADTLKNTYDASVYSVGVLPTNVDNRAKSFLNSIASSGADNKKLYYDCSNSARLVEDFEKIAKNSTEIVTEFDDVTLVDTVSAAFTLTYLQEKQLILDAINELGVTGEDVTVIRHNDGTTEIKIEHISPKMVKDGNDINFVIDFSFRVSANEKALTAGSYVTNTDNAGLVLGTRDVYENNFAVPNDTVEEADGVIYFNVNGITYHIVRVHAGEKTTQPEIELEGGYSFSGWDIPEEITFDGGKYTIEATLEQNEYTVTWIMDGKTKTDTYYYGDIIVEPEVGLNSDGDIFEAWNKTIPVTMPAENLTFVAEYVPHTHSYKETVIKKASCGVEGRAAYSCLCGDSYEMTLEALVHNWSTRATTSDDNTAYASVYCTNCGDSPDENLSYTVKGKVGKTTYEYELKLVDAKNIKVDVDGNITVSLPVPQEMKNARNLTIYREEADGTLTNLGGVKSGSYITFTTDHFSKYIIKADYECLSTDIHIDENCDNLCDMCGFEYAGLGHNYVSSVTAPTCTENGFTTYTCTICGDAYNVDEIPSYGHDMGDISCIVAPSCDTIGQILVKCLRCEYSEIYETEPTGHTDTNADNICDDCDNVLSETVKCSCNCHKKGFMGFIWKILKIFYKIFGMNRICSCGANHY